MSTIDRRRPMRARGVLLLAQSAIQHAVDDPALLVLQVSRRLPLAVRGRIGRLLADGAEAGVIPSGLGALGAQMAGDPTAAVRLLEDAHGRGGRLAGEVAVLLGRGDLVPRDAAPSTCARALWTRGDLSGALRALEGAGEGRTPYAERLRSELLLLEPGHRLAAAHRTEHGPRGGRGDRADGEELRVLHLITNSLPHTQSGYSLRTHRILQALAAQGIASVALTRTGYPVMVGRPFARPLDVVDGIVYARTLPARLGATPEERLSQEVDEALRWVDRFRPHLLHTTTDYRNALVAQAVSLATGIPWVFEVRGLMEQTWIASQASPEGRERAAIAEKARLVAAREGELARCADAVVTLSATMAEELASRGIERDAVTIVPNGIDGSLLELELSPREARRVLGIDLQDALVVGAVSALVEYEGFDVLLRAVAEIIADQDAPEHLRDRLHVVLAGDGTAAPGLVALAAELGIADRVLLPGRVPREQAPTWVQALDVVVVPRLDRAVARAVTPQKPAEAMALGRPVILSDLPALRETVAREDGRVHALLVPAESPSALAAGIVRVLEDAELRASLGHDGRDLASRRTWSELAHRYQHLYGSLLAPSDEGPGHGA